MLGLLFASTSWACIFLGGITASPASVQPGSSLNIKGLSFGSNPVELHLDTLTGTVLATVTPDAKGNFTQAVTIPQNVGTGSHIVVATEAAATPDGSNSGSAQGVPSRAMFQVGTAPPAAASTARPVQVAKSVGFGALVLIAVAVCCAGLLLGGAISLLASRSRLPAPATVAE
ncbi:MAG: hypothetical protein LC792_16680 [Actinobacteria bacterium]|nr:hypothetical protein [Actinomycetota bacterium]